MSEFLGLIIGVGIGVAGSRVVNTMSSSSKGEALQREMNNLLKENDILRRRYKEVERINEDLQVELEKQQRRAKSSGSDKEDLQDELDEAMRKVKKLTLENAELVRIIEEYKIALANAENK